MRIVHTADWHVGRVWKNLQRLDEMAAVLDHLAHFIERERIDLLLMAGDVFDVGSPPAEAERRQGGQQCKERLRGSGLNNQPGSLFSHDGIPTR